MINPSHQAGTSLLESLPEGHVIHTMIREHIYIVAQLRMIDLKRRELLAQDDPGQIQGILDQLKLGAERLLAAECHHQREERVLFPEMELRGSVPISSLFKQEHDLLRQLKNRLLSLVSDQPLKKGLDALKLSVDEIAERLIANVIAHIQKEDHDVFPSALALIDDPRLWDAIKQRCDAIGYFPIDE